MTRPEDIPEPDPDEELPPEERRRKPKKKRDEEREWGTPQEIYEE